MARWMLVGVLGVILLMSFVVEALVREPSYSKAWWDKLPGFEIMFGFIACIAIVVVSKALGKRFIQRPEDYYDRW